jgi:hypothetical protein
MVACGTSGLLGGRRVFVPLAFLVEDNILIPVVPVLAVAFLVVVFFVVGFFAVVFLVAFGLAMILSLLALFY